MKAYDAIKRFFCKIVLYQSKFKYARPMKAVSHIMLCTHYTSEKWRSHMVVLMKFSNIFTNINVQDYLFDVGLSDNCEH